MACGYSRCTSYPMFYLLWCGYEGHKWRAAMVGVPLLSMTVMIVLGNTLGH